MSTFIKLSSWIIMDYLAVPISLGPEDAKVHRSTKTAGSRLASTALHKSILGWVTHFPNVNNAIQYESDESKITTGVST